MASENGNFFVDLVVDEIKQSDLFHKYINAKNKLAENAELSEQMSEFRRFSLDLRLNAIAGREPSYDERRNASRLYWLLSLNDDAKVFMETERQLSEIVDAAFKKTVSELSLETSFFI